MKESYKNIFLNLNSKNCIVDIDKYNRKINIMKESIANSDGYTRELLTFRFEVLQQQFDELQKCKTMSGADFKKHRRLIVGNLLDDRFHELIAQDVLTSRHQNMYRIDLTSNLPLVLAYAFNLNHSETFKKIKMLCDSKGVSVGYLSCSILSQARTEVLKCDVELGELWSFFPEIKKWMGDLYRESVDTDKCLVDCVSLTPYNQILSISADDEDIQLMTALSLKLVIAGQEMINDAIVDIDNLRRTSTAPPRIYSQYICGCIFVTYDEAPEMFTVVNSSGTEYYLPVEKF